MAIEIKEIPTLKGKEAERFMKQAEKSYKKRATIDFSKQVKETMAILRKSNMML